ncbi:hypothetical protein L9W92_06765 [Pelotomaculum terephthalicicum JT]|uniref:hypothetical protein n=1 Tax=Pelotomaculum TaxID=191373 RepID=UPI0009D4D721|nr:MULTISPECIES: hypothetical protein [Pelotomaculum]MCG9967754.1 hypothetical protein [Pelotomaculum terephthalicicum JT]OPX85372.1 MAG: hypothetical protein A4E54_02420 [Pelotomaculum sp. PtaB.Bin117]OPY62695.1 MAG: hypothetical protein A4E56_01149 [Pelotomaculum sp. PtaU1.Bin065]
MLNGLLFGTVVLLLVVFSVRERVKQQRYREKDWGVIGESKSSPLSKALTNLIGVAGGIYLSLVLICTFVELQLPARVHLGHYSLEPLAAISIIMALAQPYILKVIQAWRKI